MHSYPDHLVTSLILRDGTRVKIRPIRAEDADIEQAFVRGLSDESRYFRFMDMLRELSPQMLKQLTDIDYHNQMALIAVTESKGRETEIAVARYVVVPGGENCEFAIVVDDDWQGKGIATPLMQSLIESARQRKLRNMIGIVLTSNHRMLHFVSRLGFHAAMDPEDPTQMQVTKDLGG
jgi:acetyltransferase